MLFNDRYGMHRIYYHEGEGRLLLRRRSQGDSRRASRVSDGWTRADWGSSSRAAALLENRTLFEGIHAAAGARDWGFRNGALERKGRYFQPREWEEQAVLEPEAYYARDSRRLLAKSAAILRRRSSGSDVPDRRAGHPDDHGLAQSQPGIASLLHASAGCSATARTCVVARQVAAPAGSRTRSSASARSSCRGFAHYAERTVYLTDGMRRREPCPDLYLNEKAREIAPVRMTGNYGGEVLRRVRAFKPMAPAPGIVSRRSCSRHMRDTQRPRTRMRCSEDTRCRLPCSGRRRGITTACSRSSRRSSRCGRRYLDNDFVRTVFRAPQSACCEQRCVSCG